MSITIQIKIKSCDKCPHYRDEEIDEYHGCLYTPPGCRKAKRTLKLGADIPDWCPLLDKEG